jgi:hypothetical protein
VGDKHDLQGGDVGVIENVQGSHGDDCRGFLTILESVLTVGKSAGCEERAGRPHPDFRRPPRRSGRGCKKWHCGVLHRGTTAVIQAL